jgi:hypothetical protein
MEGKFATNPREECKAGEFLQSPSLPPTITVIIILLCYVPPFFSDCTYVCILLSLLGSVFGETEIRGKYS